MKASVTYFSTSKHKEWTLKQLKYLFTNRCLRASGF